MSSDTQFLFYVFGSPRLCVNQEVIALPPQPAALCSYLVLNRQRRTTREEVQAAFWPDAAPRKAQERLRRTLYLLRRAIEPHTDLIATEGTEVAIAPDARLWVDYEAFEQALMDAYRHDPPGRKALEEAVALYTDDLLKDIYADWTLFEREHARQRFLTALRQLAGVCQTVGDWPAVVRHADLLLAFDPYQEAAHRALMAAYAASGDRSAALRQYQQCARILRDELGMEPLAETTRLYEAIREGSSPAPAAVTLLATPSPPAAPDLRAVPLVGRDCELAQIASEWRTCQKGSSRLLLITGSAGMGKTRLVDEAISRIRGAQVKVITGSCYAMEAGTPYQLVSDLMLKAVEQVADQLDAVTRSDLARLVPALQPGGPGEMATGSGDASIRLQEAVTQVIRLLAAGSGLWLVTEDLHWADPASLACLNHALRRCSDLPLMVLATLRDEEVSFDSPLLDWPTSSVHAPAPTTVIRLQPLAREELHGLLSQLVENGPAQLASLLYLETVGNPLFLVETLRALVEQGILYAEQDGAWRLRSGALSQPADLPTPDVVMRVIQGRIRRLSRATQEILTIAAVIEHDIDEKLLKRLVDPALALDLALDEVLRAFILEETSPGVYQFTHLKVREVIYADTSAPRRRFLHRAVAEAFAQSARAERLSDISRLAYHYAQAQEWTPALRYGWQAAQIASAAGALAEANRYAEVAQGILDSHAGEVDVPSLPESLPAIRFDLLTLRAEFRRRAATSGLYYPPDIIEAVEALLPEVDDSRRARASLQRATHRLGQGDIKAAREAAGQGRALYAQLHDRRGELDAAQHQFDIAYCTGDMLATRRLLDDMYRLGASVEAVDIRQMLTFNQMRLAAYEGHWMVVLHLAQELSLAQQARFDPSVAWLSLADLGLAYAKLGAYEEAYDVAGQAVAASEEAGVLGLGARVLLARLELSRGQVEQARTILLTLLERLDPLIGESEVVSPALALVRCCVAASDDEGAQRWARRAVQAVNWVRLPVFYPLSQIAWALTHVAAARYEKARNRLRYPVELMLLLEDTSPQEIFVLRAAAAQGLRETQTAQYWLTRAGEVLDQQAQSIGEPVYRESFLHRVPLHQFILSARSRSDWMPQDVLAVRQHPAASAGGSHAPVTADS